MDERLEKALDFSNYMVTLNNQKRLLKEKYYESLLYFANGSQFTVTQELITFVGFLVDKGNTEDVVLTDDNTLPSKITNLEKFYDDIIDVYFAASNEYHEGYERLKKNRKTESLVEYNGE
tara:strand:+ start:14159 stop:14518 length:360 start_codon:yes stop_codon:yes gene_type:complete